jgi:hypothetical protein
MPACEPLLIHEQWVQIAPLIPRYHGNPVRNVRYLMITRTNGYPAEP